MKPSLFIALDDLVDAEEKTLLTARRLWHDYPNKIGFKINLDYILILGVREAIYRVRGAINCPIFADLKMLNGKQTMIKVVEELVKLKVDYLSIYAQADGVLRSVTRITAGSDTKVFGVTVLTHYDEEYCQRHFRRSLKSLVRHFALIAINGGCHGLILPGTALEAVSDLNIIKVVPGIRPDWYADSRHKEAVTPRFAVEKGADILVCGSPVMKSEDPVRALGEVLGEMGLIERKEN